MAAVAQATRRASGREVARPPTRRRADVGGRSAAALYARSLSERERTNEMPASPSTCPRPRPLDPACGTARSEDSHKRAPRPAHRRSDFPLASLLPDRRPDAASTCLTPERGQSEAALVAVGRCLAVARVTRVGAQKRPTSLLTPASLTLTPVNDMASQLNTFAGSLVRRLASDFRADLAAQSDVVAARVGRLDPQRRHVRLGALPPAQRAQPALPRAGRRAARQAAAVVGGRAASRRGEAERAAGVQRGAWTDRSRCSRQNVRWWVSSMELTLTVRYSSSSASTRAAETLSTLCRRRRRPLGRPTRLSSRSTPPVCRRCAKRRSRATASPSSPSCAAPRRGCRRTRARWRRRRGRRWHGIGRLGSARAVGGRRSACGRAGSGSACRRMRRRAGRNRRA